MIIHLNAGNDSNGNPRRVFVRFDRDGYVKAAYDEGYAGTRAIPKRYRSKNGYCQFATTPAEYRSLLKQFGT